MKNLLLLFAIGFSVYYFAFDKPRNIDDLYVIDSKIVYQVSRLSGYFQGRDLDVVMVFEDYERDSKSESDYDDGKFKNYISTICGTNFQCKSKSFTCTSTVEPIYQKMLSKKKMRTKYVYGSSKSSELNSVLIWWGLNDKESVQVCDMIVSNLHGKSNLSSTFECI